MISDLRKCLFQDDVAMARPNGISLANLKRLRSKSAVNRFIQVQQDPNDLSPGSAKGCMHAVESLGTDAFTLERSL